MRVTEALKTALEPGCYLNKMTRYYTTAEVAQSLGISRQAVAQKCKRLGVPKLGEQYMITEDFVPQIANNKHGRPWSKKEKADDR